MTFQKIRPRRLRKAKSKNSQEVLQRLEDFLETECDEPVEILCGFWKDQQDAITYQELRQAVINGVLSFEMIELWRQDYSIMVTDRLKGMWDNALLAGSKGQPILDDVVYDFNLQTPGIFNWIKERGASFVTACTEEQQNAIAALLAKKMRDEHSVDELARMIRPCIGLTEGQAIANAKYYDNIVATLTKEHPRMSRENIRKKAREAAIKYAEKQHRQRAFTIAQTESAFAYNRGADEGVRQAQEQNLLGTCKKRWSTSGDDRVCETCASLEGIEIGMDESFNFKGRLLFPGHKMLPPAHPRCACAVEYIETEPPKFVGLENSLSAGETSGIIPEHDAPEYLGALDDMTEDVVKSTLKEYEKEIADSDIENAVVISKTGLAWRCYGDKNHAYPNVDLGEEMLQGAWVTHNHPIGSENEYSFSKYDINLFMGYDLEVLRGIDEFFVYELNRNPQDIDIHIPISDWDDFETRHDEVISTAERLGIGYRRWRRD